MKTIYLFMGLTLCSVTAQVQRKPNFLTIQCDYPTQRAVGAYERTQGCTFLIDEVASRGVTFSNVYVSCPLSQSSRATLWSGMMPHQTDVRSNSGEPIDPRIPENIPTLGSLFPENGYEAVHFGKAHDMGSLREFKHREPVAKPFTGPEFSVNNDSSLNVGTYEDVVAYLSNPPGEPFICIADFQDPHNICRFIRANEGAHTNHPTSGTLPKLPANFNVEDWSNTPEPVQYICCSHRYMTQVSRQSEENYRHYIAAFRHYIKIVSEQVDSVLKTFHPTPTGKNTIVIIIVDHGDGMASHCMVTKHISFYDEMTDVPLILADPGIKRQKKPVDQALTWPTPDLLPTLYDLAGTSIPAEKLGISLAPMLKGEKQKEIHPYIVSERCSEYEYVVIPGRMVRGLRYKHTHYPGGNGEELYDIRRDPGKRKNLAKDPKYSRVLAEHRAMLDNYIARIRDDYRSLKIDADP